MLLALLRDTRSQAFCGRHIRALSGWAGHFGVPGSALCSARPVFAGVPLAIVTSLKYLGLCKTAKQGP
jgi:hypothetical protein